MHRPTHRTLLVLVLIYGAASLLHFVHNAEFLADYPNLPASWSRAGVYRAWLVLTVVGVAGWVFLSRGHQRTGLVLIALYAIGGLDSLGHYVLAPFADHTRAMNATIVLEVAAAALLFSTVVWQLVQQVLLRRVVERDA
jgi:hypothetical protein